NCSGNIKNSNMGRPMPGAKEIMEPAFQQGILGCFGNMGVCVISFFLPCIQAGRNAEAVGDNFILTCVGIFIPLVNLYFLSENRAKIRHMQSIRGDTASDCAYIIVCGPCSLSQLAAECDYIRNNPKPIAVERE
ncbi:unnamed protein product, partial [Owenia fusiformis]